jgi:uncharacterized phage protein (predicted DNA packaging)
MEEILDQLYPWKNILSDVKSHIQLPEDYTEEDSYIRSLIQIATMAVFNHINWTSEDIKDMSWENLPPALLHSVRLMVGNLYSNRESVADVKLYEIPKSYDYLLSPYIKY